MAENQPYLRSGKAYELTILVYGWHWRTMTHATDMRGYLQAESSGQLFNLKSPLVGGGVMVATPLRAAQLVSSSDALNLAKVFALLNTARFSGCTLTVITASVQNILYTYIFISP